MKKNYKYYYKQIDNIKLLKRCSFLLAFIYIGSTNLIIVKIQEMIDILSNGKISIDSFMVLQFIFLLLLFFISSIAFQYLFRRIPYKGKKRFLEKLYKDLIFKGYIYNSKNSK